MENNNGSGLCTRLKKIHASIHHPKMSQDLHLLKLYNSQTYTMNMMAPGGILHAAKGPGT